MQPQALKRLQQLVQPLVPLQDEEWELLASQAQIIQLKKGEHWLKEGQVAQHIGFVVQGILRIYHNNQDKVFISHFCCEERNPIVAAYTSFIYQKPSLEAIQALEDCQLYLLSYQQLQSCYASSIRFERLGRLLMEQTYVAAKQRFYYQQQRSAAERYAYLLDKYPNLVQRIPLHHLAAYLGIAPESLSRLRRL